MPDGVPGQEDRCFVCGIVPVQLSYEVQAPRNWRTPDENRRHKVCSQECGRVLFVIGNLSQFLPLVDLAEGLLKTLAPHTYKFKQILNEVMASSIIEHLSQPVDPSAPRKQAELIAAATEFFRNQNARTT